MTFSCKTLPALHFQCGFRTLARCDKLWIPIWLVASGSVLAEVPEFTLVEQMAAEKLVRGLEMQRLEMRLTNIEQMLEQIRCRSFDLI